MMKRYLFIFLLIASVTLVAVPLAVTSCGDHPAETNDSQPKAAIVDQLYLLEANQPFIDEATAMLESYGFAVDVWRGEEITVDFYRELPEHGYKLIVFRVHSGLLLALLTSGIVPSKKTYLFTGEEYTTAKYVSEQLTERVANAMMTTEYPLVFAVNSEFITEKMEGNFDDTVVIMMGCESYYLDDMAEAFIDKGASAYMGWSGVVSLEYVDKATLDLLGNLCTENLTVQYGVATTMADLGFDPHFRAYLKYYPEKSGHYTIRQLVE